MVEGYGEAEFVFASLKIITILGLLVMAFILFWGGGPSRDRVGFRYWKDPGAMKPYLVPGAAGKLCGFLKSFVNACFAFGGSEVICVAVIPSFLPVVLFPMYASMDGGIDALVQASETLNPRRNIPKAVRRTFWRVVIFYVFGVLAIGVLVPYNDAGLTAALKEGKSGAAASPFVPPPPPLPLRARVFR